MRMARYGLSEGGKGVSHTDIWGKIFQAKGAASVNALRWECRGSFKEQPGV